jgi:sodium/hydrogen exchanger 10/11
MFGSILGATDPVAVVALLKDVGACPKLGTIMEGESLLNDGTAIVVFTLFLSLSKGGVYTGGEVVLLFLRVAIGGPIFGWLSGKLTVVLIAQVFNDALIEITLTIAASYITFYVAEAWLGVSGVLALVALGLECNLNRAHISPEVEKFLHGFWEMMAYLTNTVIFTLVGVVIAERAFNDVEPRDWFYLLSLYIGLTIIRGITIALLSPLLSRLGYGISWEKGIVVTWGGLRGAVGLSLALVVEHDEVLHHIVSPEHVVTRSLSLSR